MAPPLPFGALFSPKVELLMLIRLPMENMAPPSLRDWSTALRKKVLLVIVNGRLDQMAPPSFNQVEFSTNELSEIEMLPLSTKIAPPSFCA